CPLSSAHHPAADVYTLSLHDALPICCVEAPHQHARDVEDRHLERHDRGDGQSQPQHGLEARPVWSPEVAEQLEAAELTVQGDDQDRKSTRLNSSHVKISYAVFCLKKK